MEPYTEQFYRAEQEGARRSARAIVPLVLDLVQPQSVIDIGCGLGTWLSVFAEQGVRDLYGVDGDHVNRAMLEISPDRFLVADLRRPFQLDRRFDLVVSLEVAEHLPSECAEIFVTSLTGLGSIVLFSAAAPFQGGTHHVNEQWPEYWAERFRRKGYLAIDCLRRRVWQNERVEWWYAQNILLFASPEQVELRPSLQQEYGFAGTSPLSLVHPKRYLEWVEWGLRQCER